MTAVIQEAFWHELRAPPREPDVGPIGMSAMNDVERLGEHHPTVVKNGMPTEDFILIRGSDWLALHGRDEPPGEAP